MAQRNTGPAPGEALLLGALAGAAAVWVMDRVDWFNYRHGLDTEATRRRTEAARPEGGLDPGHVVAARAARALGLPQPRPPEQNAAGLAVHYAIGMAPASLYAALRGRAPALTAGHGALFGLGLFLLQDELANAALGLSGPPRRYPWTAHARGLIAHLVYGVVLETACRAMGLPRRRRA